jgi:hypothetical protein
MQIEYRCPTHGVVEPDDLYAPVPTCPLMLRRQLADKIIVEVCGQPLTSYLS